MKKTIAILFLIFISALVPSNAQGATIPKKIVFQAERIDNTNTGVSRQGRGVIVMGVKSPPLAQLILRSRGLNGSLGRSVNLTYTANAEMPKDVVFNDSGDLFLSWGVATVGAKGEFVSQKSGQPFGPVQTYSSLPCTRFQSVDKKPDGGLLIACSVESGIAPNDQAVFVSSLPDFFSTSFSSPVTAQSGTDDPFLQPKTDVAPDGTTALAWSTRRESPPGVFLTRIRALVSESGDWLGSPTTNLSFINSATAYVSGGIPLALNGGKVAVLWTEGNSDTPSFGRLNLGILNSAGTIEDADTIATKPTASYSMVREGDNILISWSETEGGMGDPYTTKVATYSPNSGSLSSPETLEINSDKSSGKLQINKKGDVVLSRGDGASISAWLKPKGQSRFSDPKTIYSGSFSLDQRMVGESISLDDKGNVFSSWIVVDENPGVNDSVFWGGLDFEKPSFRIKAPRKIKAGKRIVLRAASQDTSGIRKITWQFQGGSKKSGSVVRQRYKKPGRYSFKVTAIDRAGNKKTIRKIVKVS